MLIRGKVNCKELQALFVCIETLHEYSSLQLRTQILSPHVISSVGENKWLLYAEYSKIIPAQNKSPQVTINMLRCHWVWPKILSNVTSQYQESRLLSLFPWEHCNFAFITQLTYLPAPFPKKKIHWVSNLNSIFIMELN